MHLYSLSTFEQNDTAAQVSRCVLLGCRGYTTGVFILAHAMATSEAAWVAVISRAIQAKDGVVACITIPGVYYPRLINWALAAKLVLAR